MQSYLYLSKSIYLEVAKLIIHLKIKLLHFSFTKVTSTGRQYYSYLSSLTLEKKRKEASAKRVSRYRVYYLFNLLRVHLLDA